MTKPLYINQSAASSEIAKAKRAAAAGQLLLDELEALSLPFKIKTMPELQRLMQDGEAYVRERIEEGMEKPTILGIPVSAKRAYDLLEMPSMERLNTLSKESKEYTYSILKCTLHKGTVTLTPEAEETIRDSYSILCTTPKRARAREAMDKAAKSMEEFRETVQDLLGGSYDPLHSNLTLGELFLFENSTLIAGGVNKGPISPNDNFFKSISNQIRKAEEDSNEEGTSRR